jgi:astacin
MRRVNSVFMFVLMGLAMVVASPTLAQESICDEKTGEVCQPDQGWVVGPEGAMWVEFERVDGKAIVDGDIIVEVISQQSGPVAAANSATTAVSTEVWPSGVIPYGIDPSLPNQSRVTDAVAHWNTKTGVTLVPRTSQVDYIEFIPASGCWSWIGQQGGRQEIGLADGCLTGSTIHEIGHAAGLWHEQTRQDRDTYVTIHFGNITSGKEHNFQKYPVGEANDTGPYDYGSIMHYSKYAFSKNGQPTIVPVDSSANIGQRSGLSAGDVGGVASLYGYPPSLVLERNVPVTNLAAAKDGEIHFSMAVPAGASDLSFDMSEGTGDADLYIRFGAVPTEGNYDCRPYNGGNVETCEFASPNAGTWYGMVHGYSEFTGVRLVGTFEGPSYVLQNGVPETDLAASPAGEALYFTLEVPSGQDELTFETSGGTGDADLYVKFGSEPTTGDYDCRPYTGGNVETCEFDSPNAGTWYGMVHAYTPFDGVELTGTYDSGPACPPGGPMVCSYWDGQASSLISVRGFGRDSWNGPASMDISNGTFYADSDGLVLTGSISQRGTRISASLSNGSISSLESALAQMFPGSVSVTVTRSRIRTSLQAGSGGEPDSVSMQVQLWLMVQSATRSGLGTFRTTLTLNES